MTYDWFTGDSLYRDPSRLRCECGGRSYALAAPYLCTHCAHGGCVEPPAPAALDLRAERDRLARAAFDAQAKM